ncbi:MAG: excinuclease ABC subunit UvrB [Coxiellaceae bacterium]|jgi:excinuclease ABC subunit B|nr:excinuclease ABC subunit UvrB [Coxiellaceae bacterium]
MSSKFNLQTNLNLSITQLATVKKIVQGLSDGFNRQTLLGATGCGKTFTLANVIAISERPTLIIAHNKILAAQLYGEMQSFFPKNAVEYFVSYYDYYQPEAYLPVTDTHIDKSASINEYIEQMRLAATKALFERHDVIIVASVSAIYGLGAPEVYGKMILTLKLGDKIEPIDFFRHLTELQYNRNDLELRRGTYRFHDRTIDIFPAESKDNALRIELIEDHVNKIIYIDPLTGKTFNRISSVKIFPRNHYVTKRKVVLSAIEQIKIELRDRLSVLYNDGKLIEAQRLKQRTEYDIEMLLELGYCTGIENYSRYLSERAVNVPPSTLIDYLPKDSLLIIDESHVTLPQLRGMYYGDNSRKTTLIEYGFRLPSALDNRPLKFEEFEKLSPPTIYVSATPGDFEKRQSQQVIELLIRPTGLIDPEVEIKPAKNQIDDLFSEINKRIKLKERVIVITLTKKIAEDLTEYLTDYDIKVRYLHSNINAVERVEILRDFRLGVFDVLVGVNLLREGLDLPEVSLVAILDADKEGFLRSTQSLIQTSGRASRNVNGSVIMYADRITTSMRSALDEMNRRRRIQQAYNVKHKIIPTSIIKDIRDIMTITHISGKENHQIFIKEESYLTENPDKITQHISKLEKKMYQYARDLEFEKAVKIRDKIHYFHNLLKK